MGDLVLQEGSLVEVFTDEDWWDAEVIKVKNGQVCVHYVGGADDENEWIPLQSNRIRLGGGAELDSQKQAGKRGREAASEPAPIPSFLPFKSSTTLNKEKAGRKQLKNLKKILEAENYDKLPLNAPTYTNVESPPSVLPPKKYCDLTGLETRYEDPKTRLRYFSTPEYVQLKYISEHNVQEFLKFRNANVLLK